MQKLLLCLFALAAVAQGAEQRVNPVEKVISLLKKLRGETEAEGAKEAAAYDKFACFCKENADEKMYLIEKAEKREAALKADIEDHAARIAALDQEVTDLTANINKMEDKQEKTAAQRAVERQAYETENADLNNAVRALKGAIEALKASKDSMQNAKLNMLQIRDMLATAQAMKLDVPEHVTAFLQAAPGTAHGYEYRSNEIIAVLEGLKKTFTQKLYQVDAEETATKQEHEMEFNDRRNMIIAATDTREEKAKQSADLSAAKAQLENDLAETEADHKADQAFLDDLTNQCEAKARNWDQRSKTRSAELQAISEAMELLEGKVTENFGANKKLVFAQMDSATAKGVKRVIELIASAAKVQRSTTLSALLMTIKADPFVKVRGLVNDLIKRLEDEAKAEAEQKAWCDKQISAATEARDTDQATIEDLNAKMTELKANIERLSNEISHLEASIADLNKSLNEAQELRNQEHEENTQTISDAKEGQAAVAGALEILSQFYQGAAFVQWEPPNAGSDGQNVDMVKPETFEGDYKGNQAASKSILGLLEVIKSDFERTVDTTTADEKEAAEAFDAFKKDTEKDIDEKTKTKGEKETEKENAEGDLASATDDHKSATQSLADTMAELEKLKPPCVNSGSSWDEKTERRTQEIESLKEALAILESTTGHYSFLQKK